MKKIIIVFYFIILACSCNQNTNKVQLDQLSPLDKLKLGNQRFAKGAPIHPDETLQRIRELKKDSIRLLSL